MWTPQKDTSVEKLWTPCVVMKDMWSLEVLGLNRDQPNHRLWFTVKLFSEACGHWTVFFGLQMEEKTTYTRMMARFIPENGGCGLGNKGIKRQNKSTYGLICFIWDNFIWNPYNFFASRFQKVVFANMSRRASYAGGSKLPTGKSNGFAGQENGGGAPFGPAAPPRKRFDPCGLTMCNTVMFPNLTSKAGWGTWSTRWWHARCMIVVSSIGFETENNICIHYTGQHWARAVWCLDLRTISLTWARRQLQARIQPLRPP